MSDSQASSSITLTFRSLAFFALLPAPGPATTRSVRAETDPVTFAPADSALVLASFRVIFSSVPVKTMVMPDNSLPAFSVFRYVFDVDQVAQAVDRGAGFARKRVNERICHDFADSVDTDEMFPLRAASAVRVRHLIDVQEQCVE